MRRFAQAWQATAYRLARTLGEQARIDEQELLDLVDDKVYGANPAARAVADGGDGWPDGSPSDRLHATGLVVRDFRDLDRWDRTKRYDPRVYGYPSDKSRGMSLGSRDWTAIDTIVLHTAAVELGPDRGLGIPSHALVDRDGGLVLQHYLQAYLAAAHRANSYSVSLEISGNRTISPDQVPAARAWCRYAVETLRQEHLVAGFPRPIKVICHRMSHESRVNDCDLQIWRAVGEWCIDELGCDLGEVVGSGRPIPGGWWTPGREVLS